LTEGKLIAVGVSLKKYEKGARSEVGMALIVLDKKKAPPVAIAKVTFAQLATYQWDLKLRGQQKKNVGTGNKFFWEILSVKPKRYLALSSIGRFELLCFQTQRNISLKLLSGKTVN
jgi:hypothetical protein